MQKVLIIAYYWPPAGGPGVQRWLKFVKYLPQFEIEPIVFAPENPNYPIADESLLNEISADLKVYKYPITEPYKLARLLSKSKTKRISSGIINTESQTLSEKLMLWVRGNCFIPDARKNWVKPSVKYLKHIIEKESINTIITTGPPHSVHLIGLQLKESLGVKWISDFRDPWTSIGYHKKLRLTSRSKKKHKHLEQLVLNSADSIIVTSSTTKKEFKAITKKPISVITNGFDSDYKGDASLASQFTISHIGSLLTGRNPENLWEVLSELVNEDVLFADSFKLQLAGAVSEDVLNSIYDNGLKEYVKLIGYISHDEAVELQKTSQVLLLVEIDSNDTIGILPGKLYEYMAAKRPILGLGPKDWEASTLIQETNTGYCFDYDAKSDLKNVILSWFKSFKEGNLNIEPNNIEKFSRRSLTKELSKLI